MSREPPQDRGAAGPGRTAGVRPLPARPGMPALTGRGVARRRRAGPAPPSATAPPRGCAAGTPSARSRAAAVAASSGARPARADSRGDPQPGSRSDGAAGGGAPSRGVPGLRRESFKLSGGDAQSLSRSTGRWSPVARVMASGYDSDSPATVTQGGLRLGGGIMMIVRSLGLILELGH